MTKQGKAAQVYACLHKADDKCSLAASKLPSHPPGLAAPPRPAAAFSCSIACAANAPRKVSAFDRAQAAEAQQKRH